MTQKLACYVTGAMAVAATGIYAQDADRPEQFVSVLEEVIVTATKRESRLQDTALSVGVLSGADLVESGAANLHDYWRRVPSLVVTDQAFGGDRITIRGLGEEPNGIAESMSAVYFDETPINQADGLFTMSPDFQLVDIQRVEVLRGPQGTLFGASAMGGAVRIIANSPDFEGSYGFVEGEMSATSHGGINFDTSVMWNQPVGDNSAVRFVAYYQDNDGWIDDIGLGQNNVNSFDVGGGRLAWRWSDHEALEITAKLQIQSRDINGFNLVDPVGKPELDILTNGDYQFVGLSPQFRSEDATLFSLTAEYSGAWADWISITSWTNYDAYLQTDLAEEARYLFLGVYAPIVSTTGFEQEVLVQELRAASKPGSAIQWLGGLFYLDQDVPRTDLFVWPDNAIFPSDVIGTTVSKDTRRDWGVFGEVSWAISERLTGTVGARWYDVEKNSRSTLNGLATGFQDVESVLDYSEDGMTPKASLSLDATDSTMFYVLVSQGYRAGGANTPLAVNDCGAPVAFGSDDLWNYEIGLKTWSEDGRMSLNLSAYSIDWSDAQTEVNVPDCQNIYVVNAGEASSDGIEAEWSYLVTDNWDLRIAAGYNDSKITKTVPGSGIPAGADIPLVPELTAAITSSHRFILFGQPGGFLRLDWQYTGETDSSLFPSFNVRQDDYSLFSLRFGFESGRWSTTLFADNIFDEQATILCCRFDGGFITNRPRTYGVRARFDFQ